MCSNNRPNICGEDLCIRKPLLNSSLQGLCAIRTSAMPNDNDFSQFRRPALFHFGKLGLDGLFPPPWFLHHSQFSIPVHMEERFDLQGSSKNCRTGGHPPAPPQMIKHIHREPVADLQAMLGHPSGQLLQGISFGLPPGCLADQKSLSH